MKEVNSILKKYVCTTPFKYVEVHKGGFYSCCPSWLPVKISDLDNIEQTWNSEELKKIHESLLDGSYKYCSKTECPYLAELIETGEKPSGFIEKEEFDFNNYKDGPQNINFAFDRSCNLSCPSCRNFSIMADGTEIEFVDSTIDKISKTFGKNIKMFYLSGTADPFASKSFRKFLMNFDKNIFPNVNHIHLHTNALLLNEKMWNSLTHIHDLIKSIEISIDAANEETYNILRRGGDWNVLLENLKFISTTKIKNKNVSFVVQDTNYKEMEDFYILMNKIFGHRNKVNVFYNKIQNWGTYSDAEYKLKKVWDTKHPEYKLLIEELKKITKYKNVTHNMFDLLDRERTETKLLI